MRCACLHTVLYTLYHFFSSSPCKDWLSFFSQFFYWVCLIDFYNYLHQREQAHSLGRFLLLNLCPNYLYSMVRCNETYPIQFCLHVLHRKPYHNRLHIFLLHLPSCFHPNVVSKICTYILVF